MMGMKDKVMDKAAVQISGHASKLFNDIIRIQESMHGYLEKILEVQRTAHNYQRMKDCKAPIDFEKEDKLQ